MTTRTDAIVETSTVDPLLVRRFDVAPAALAEARTLQARIDRKYLLAPRQLEALLELLSSTHLLLPAGGNAWARYESVYFDSADRDLFHTHRRGLVPRYKVRIRHHVDRELTFLEIKRKERRARTVKFRMLLPIGQVALGAEERRFIEAHTPLDIARFVPTVTIAFLRLTLLGREMNERLTVDRNLTVVAGGRTIRVPPAVIAEIKQPRYSHYAGGVSALRDVHAREMGLSKYCLGTLLSAPVRGNTFKPLLRALERLSA